MTRRLATAAVVVLASLLPAAPLHAEVIHETDGPFGGFFGLWGYDVSADQSVGQRITPAADYTLDVVRMWFMNNDGSGFHPRVTVTLRDDDSSDGMSRPGNVVYESWQMVVSAVGWDPQLESVHSVLHPPLRAGVNYWIVCASNAPGGEDGVWNIAAFGTGFMSNTDPFNGGWYAGHEGAVTCLIVEATPAPTLHGDLDGDCDVDLTDLAVLLSNFGRGEGATHAQGDVDGDGDVDLTDLATLLVDFGRSC